jgi:16S rRNA processing protein RimM
VVETAAGERIGEVVRVDGGAAGSLLAIDGPRGEILIPLAVDITTTVDVNARRIAVNPPEGLLELNERTDRIRTGRTTRTDRTIRTTE